MSRIYDMIKGLLPKKISANSGNSDEQPQRSEEELETICESKSLLQKRKTVLGNMVAMHGTIHVRYKKVN